jgi:Questin oxidase-like
VTPVNVPALLSKYGAYSSNYGVPTFPLSDHLPMAVVALAEMGASAERIEAWAAQYATKHQLRPADAGERKRRSAWYQKISVEGREAVLAGALPGLSDGIGAAAFHPAIRAGYAIEQSDDQELASALESWDREFLDLTAPEETRAVEIDEALALLAASTIRVEAGGLIAPLMQRVAAHPEFATIAEAVPRSEDINKLALAAAVAFAESGDFTALHVMTGTYAMRTISGFFVEPDAEMPGFWRAYAAAALVSGTIPTLAPEKLASLRAEAPTDWAPLLTQAIANEDEHVIKATYTAWRLDTNQNDPIYRTTAHRYLTPTSSPPPTSSRA